MHSQVVKEAEITEDLDAAVRKTLALCFPRHKDDFSWSRTLKGNRPLFTAVVEENNKVIAHAAVVERTVEINGKNYRVAGVQNVCVLSPYRGKRFGDMVLKPLMQCAVEQDFDFGLLFTRGRIEKLYARNGWFRIEDRCFIQTDDGKESRLLPTSIKMYYPIKLKEFPAGEVVNLLGNKW